jgi:hypothetical protein
MAEFVAGDKVKVKLTQGYSKRGVFGISVLYTTSPEARFEGATGTIKDVNPVGPYSSAQYLVDFRGHDNGRLALPWQAHWFREEWLALSERAAGAETTRRGGAEDSASPVASGTGPGRTEGDPG